MRPSEVVAEAVAQAHCQHPEIRAMSFDKFITWTASLAQDPERVMREEPDKQAFHAAVMTTLGDHFLPAAFSLKATALSIGLGETDNAMPALATDWPWVTLLDERGRELYRAMNDIYVIAAQRVAQEFESHGWLINTDSIT